MPRTLPRLIGTTVLCGGLAAGAHAVDVGISQGVGPNGFHSTGLDIGQAWHEDAFRADASYYRGTTDGAGPEQFIGSLSWQATAHLAATGTYKRVRDEFTTNSGGDLGLALSIDGGAFAAHPATATVTYGRLEYDPHGSNVAPAVLALKPTQSHWQVSWWQAFSARWAGNIGYDDYDYSKSPLTLARAIAILALRRNTPITGAYVAIGFPDSVGTAGLSFYPSDRYMLLLNHSDVKSVAGQSSSSTSLGLTRTFGRFTLGGTVSQNHNSSLATAAGVQILPASDGTYFDLRLGASF